MHKSENEWAYGDSLLTDNPYYLFEIRKLAQTGGWIEMPSKKGHVNQGIVFERPYADGFERIRYWYLGKKQTVQTYLLHPKHGPGQSHTKKSLTRRELALMFQSQTGPGMGLRLHTQNKRRRDMANVRGQQRK